MSVRAIEAEVSIKSGVQAECTIGREVIRTVYDEPVLESLSVTENGLYEPSEGVDGFNSVTVNVEAPKDPNVYEGEFTATETGILAIDTGYEGNSYPKAIMIYDADGIIKDDAPLAYTISAFMAIKSNGDTPTYSGDTDENQWRHQTLYTNGSRAYSSSSSSASYICTQTHPTMGATTSVKMPDASTLKVYVSEITITSATRFRVGIRYKYKVFY